MNADLEQVENIKEAYLKVYKDILQGLNLETHLKDVELAIVNVEKSIAVHEQQGLKTDFLHVTRNELFRLKYEILEKL